MSFTKQAQTAFERSERQLDIMRRVRAMDEPDRTLHAEEFIAAHQTWQRYESYIQSTIWSMGPSRYRSRIQTMHSLLWLHFWHMMEGPPDEDG